MKKIIMKKTVFIATVALLVVAFGISAIFLGNYLLEGKQEEERNKELSNIVANAQSTATTGAEEETTEATEPEATTEPTEPKPTEILPGYKEVYELNDHTVGWLTIEDTKLDYPVMHTPDDKNYYLYRDFDRNNNIRGSVYAWWAADINEPSDNITLFGHNMRDGSMFACLNDYVTKEAWEYNPLITFNTLYEYHTYKIFAVFKTSANEGQGFAYHRFTNAKDQAEFDEFVKTCKDLAFYDTGITPQYGDKLICLSTCEYTLNNGRLVVAAVRIT